VKAMKDLIFFLAALFVRCSIATYGVDVSQPVDDFSCLRRQDISFVIVRVRIYFGD
jgi:hypothetical protein